ncbi:2,3-bisphosphoglycerate-independent phosphoglycerate mutase [Methylomonas sp. LL1]|uniref:2,3-bisphosphoglycerate-independent phosphoglycerate mutase n=1 Tax=Methylomonas sp. LL1 TaxID=2785785 RepID=UPI0018C38FB3|nr:2,3-bisphosphoglycerate-independent phosphoglycerate mutase [Methylomonas sp. LL1]QPK63431.1 2,3-bisphosphoglycerate-independent phosphoglycerate mutase [Methylomonas sp. LL1]
MKTVMIVIDGLGDEPIPELNGKTPLQVAHAPNIHFIANRGQIGRIQTTFPGFPIESMVCIMGLLGYAPEKYYPCGRASFEAMAKGIPLKQNDLVLRCNLVTIDPKKQILKDFTAGLINDSHARALISKIDLPFDNWELYPGQSYRNILIIRGANVSAKDIKCFEPHMHINGNVRKLLPCGTTPTAKQLADQLDEFLMGTQKQIKNMSISGQCTANMLWLWSPSIKPIWPSFTQQHGLRGAVVGGLDFLHGIAMAAGMHFDVIPGATGYIDTDYQAKADYTIKYLKDYDFILTHINATDEEAHQRNFTGKIEAIERIDHFVVAPILTELVRKYSAEFKIIICGDHGTRCRDGKHISSPVPYSLYGNNIKACNTDQFCESSCSLHPPINSLFVIEKLIEKQKA